MSLFRVVRGMIAIILFTFYRVKVVGKENIPKDGPAIICPNHVSNLDPPFVGITCPRDMYFMAKAELFNKPLSKKFMLNINSFPVKRGLSDRNALRTGIDILNRGDILCLFLEGSRNKTGEVRKALGGAGFFALRSDAVIIPCAIVGSYKIFRPITVIYGKPIDMTYYRENKTSAKEVSEVIMLEIQELLKG